MTQHQALDVTSSHNHISTKLGGLGEKKRRATEDDSEMCLCETAKILEPCWIYRTENAEE